MSFTSVFFLIVFLPVSVLCHYFAKEKYRNIWLVFVSIAFYFWAGLSFLVILLASALVAYGIGLGIGKVKKIAGKRALLGVGLVFHIGVLFYFKYLFTAITYFLAVVKYTGHTMTIDFTSPLLPLGISFYTFSMISYIVDVYWEKVKVNRNFGIALLYFSFFPRVVQGPIMRYSDFEGQLQGRQVTEEMLYHGIERFIIGMAKKLIIADQLVKVVDYAFDNSGAIGTAPAWIGILAYLLQLYFDFSGYSDMALGLGSMFGFKLPENFRYPYLSASCAEYWRRWHISLGEWLRDYVYMPMSRTLLSKKWIAKSKNPMMLCDICALFVTWVVTGIWHGSKLQFLAHGMWWFAFIAFERVRDAKRKKRRKAKKLPVKKNSVIQNIGDHALTLFAIVFGQVLFRANGLRAALSYWKTMLTASQPDGIVWLLVLTNSALVAFFLGIVFCFPIYPWLMKRKCMQYKGVQAIYSVLLVILFILAFAYAVSAGYTPFLYQVF
ncbi:MAG TPA: MBOAT family O-acyltransferase [Bacillota bacterium]|nr:MBOAT family O-acyltransferase [Bacillota bacterium]